MSMGVAIGIIPDQMTICMCIGIAIGAALDSRKIKFNIN